MEEIQVYYSVGVRGRDTSIFSVGVRGEDKSILFSRGTWKKYKYIIQ